MNAKELKRLLEACDDDFEVYICPTKENPIKCGMEVKAAVITQGERYGNCITLVYEE